VIFPHEGHAWGEPVFAGAHRLNGNRELTGLEWVRESGLLMSPIGLTNTHSVGVVRDALVALDIEALPPETRFWSLPVVGETWDGRLNDVNGRHVKPDHVRQAIAAARAGAVAEGNVGGGTGMICHGFKGGIGTASRVLDSARGGYAVGVLVQANHGRRERLRVNGLEVGAAIPAEEVPLPASATGEGSIIVVIATDAPLLPGQCARLAQRAGLGIAVGGGVGEHYSGDLFLAFATGNRGIPADQPTAPLEVGIRMCTGAAMTALFDAVVDATHEAIVNALLAAETMTGQNGVTAHALEPERLVAAMAD
jgi:D-aminopeptidase